MENQNVFKYRYSAPRNKEVEYIRQKYLPREKSKLDELKELDRKAQSAGHLVSLVMGIIGCLVFGIAMCFGLGVLTADTWVTVTLGVTGILIMLPAYPTFRAISAKAKRLLTPRILELSDEITKKQ